MAITINASTSGGLVQTADTSGTLEIQSAGVTKLTVSSTGAYGSLVSGTAATASGTSVDFTGIPSWVKRVNVMFDGLSTSGTSNYLVQLGDSGGVENTGYLGSATALGSTTTSSSASATTGVTILRTPVASDTYSGVCTIANINANSWVVSANAYNLNAANPTTLISGGNKTLSATLDRIRITTVNGTDTFDAGSINIMYEG